MFEMFIDAGPFAYVITALGLIALGLNIVQLARRQGRDLKPLIIGLSAAALLMGLAGTGAGLYMAGKAIGSLEAADKIPRLFGCAVGIAMTTTAFGALWATLNGMLVSIGHTVRAR